MNNSDKIYIILLNYKGWKDTIECLESVLKLDYTNYQIIICDNNSPDNSLKKMIDWTKGKIIVTESLYPKLVFPLEKKPIKYGIIDKDTLEKREEKILFLQTGKNLGFAGGNNYGIKYALKQNDFSYIWFLNNDTVVQKDSLSNLKFYMEQKDKVGICGSRLMCYHSSGKLQGLAGLYNPIWGTTKHIKNKNKIKNMDYVIGASMLVSKKFIKNIGLMNENYFLYYEELDWAERGKKMFKFDVSLDSVVYHKEGATIGANSNRIEEKSLLSDFYMIRNRILFTKSYYPKYIYTVYLGLLISILNRIRRKKYQHVKMIIDLILGKEKKIYKYLYKNKQ